MLLYLKFWGSSRDRITRNNREKWKWRQRNPTEENGPVIKKRGESEHSPARVAGVVLWPHPHQVMPAPRVRRLLQKQGKLKGPFLSNFCGTLKVQAVSSSGVSSRKVDRGGSSFTSVGSCHLWCWPWHENLLQRARVGKEKNGNYSSETRMTWYYLSFPSGVPKAVCKELHGVCVCVSVSVCSLEVLQNGWGWREVVLCVYNYYPIVSSMFSWAMKYKLY